MSETRQVKQAIVIHPTDNVATALIDLVTGNQLSFPWGHSKRMVIVKQPIPRGHKIAIRPIAVGMPIVKYGEQIGVAASPIEEGAHVHTHNVASTRVSRKQEIL